ncbi:MAG: hypothetical protein HS115_20205 [Spirochaetales bacterium]|nr:hypothetical protein [Spirochaetales bacterium]
MSLDWKSIFFKRFNELISDPSGMDEVERISTVDLVANLSDQKASETYIENVSNEHLLALLAGYPITDEDRWPWHAKAISEGKYPLNNLPEGVRELARTLYYEK